MYNKNDVLTVSITDISNDGEGIGKIDGFPIFIKDTIIGDEAEIKIIKAKKNYAFARLVRIIKPSSERCSPLCDVSRPCGGCQIQELEYGRQLEFKQQKVFNNLTRIGGIDRDYLSTIMEPIIGMENPVRYRNKSQYPIGYNKEGKIVAGFYAGRTHSVIPCGDCKIGPEHNKHILNAVISWMEEKHFEPYDEKIGKGLLRHVLIREGFSTGEIMVVIVVNSSIDSDDIFSKYESLVERLKLIAGLASVQLNENRENTNVILGKKCRVIYGREYIEDILCGLKFKISPLSFYQVNPVQTSKLYDTARQFANLTGEEEVWDICCGIGTITLCLAKDAAKVHGLEIVPEAIEDAKKNAILNSIENADFICAPAEEYMPSHRNSIKADVIVVDPPRKGMEKAALETMVYMKPDRIVYVSCDSATLARDVKYLEDNGYRLRKVRPCDMFPHSVHVETVVLLENVG